MNTNEDELWFKNQIDCWNKCEQDGVFEFSYDDLYPQLNDHKKYNGNSVDMAYFVSSIFVAKQIISCNPLRHHDIGSPINEMLSKLLVGGIDVVSIDIRRTPMKIDGIEFVEGDATNLLEYIPPKSVDSLSVFYSLEHFGLGRYGDTICPKAWIDGLKGFVDVLKPGGLLYIVTSVGKKNLLRFNAHRVFRPKTIIDQIDKEMELQFFGIVENWSLKQCDIELDQKEIGGVFVFKKLSDF